MSGQWDTERNFKKDNFRETPWGKTAMKGAGELDQGQQYGPARQEEK
jgi:hypothetical protein